MSHAEIWDDSALVNSWNEALEEYKYYHSLQARGQKVEDATHSTQRDYSENTIADELANQEVTSGAKVLDSLNTTEPGMEVHRESKEGPPLGSQSENKLSQGEQAFRTRQSEGSSGGRPAPSLQNLIGSVHDEGLKNLLMSWYYAGYYTGLYEGQQQTRHAAAEGT